MTIAFITPEYPHHDLKGSAGLGTSIKNLAKGLTKSGVKVVVFVAFQNQNIEFEDQGITVITIARKGYRLLGWYLERKYIENEIEKHIASKHIQLLEAPDWTGITAFMNFKIPLSLRLHGSDAYFCHLEGRRQKWKNFILEKLALKKADAIISVSAFTGHLTKKLFGIQNDIKTIHNSIDTSKFSPIDCEITSGQLLYFGTIIRKKGVLELAQIFNRVIEERPQATLKLVGKDVVDNLEGKSTLAIFYAHLSTEAAERVVHIAEVPYDTIKNHISQAEVIVLPSFAEAFPMTWIESMAMQKPLVASNVGWAEELVVHDKTGFLVNPKDHKAFAKAILTLLNDKAKRQELGLNGRKYVLDNLSTDMVVQQNIKYYKRLISIYDTL